MDEVTQTPRIPSHKERVANQHIYALGSTVGMSRRASYKGSWLPHPWWVRTSSLPPRADLSRICVGKSRKLTCGSSPNFEALYSSPFSPLAAKAKAIKKPKRKGGAYTIGTQSTISCTSPSFSERRKPLLTLGLKVHTMRVELSMVVNRPQCWWFSLQRQTLAMVWSTHHVVTWGGIYISARVQKAWSVRTPLKEPYFWTQD